MVRVQLCFPGCPGHGVVRCRAVVWFSVVVCGACAGVCFTGCPPLGVVWCDVVCMLCGEIWHGVLCVQVFPSAFAIKGNFTKTPHLTPESAPLA